MAAKQPEREEYTIAWICALSHELTACRLLFDEAYEDLEAANSADHNTYCLGRVAQHNVVAACLPDGSYGTNSAATVATNLLASFPGVRFGVLVGIGGGVPSREHDIRLGDVVVSRPEGTSGGVIQYDLGKHTVDGFKRVGSLNRPPEELLATVSKLRSNFEMETSSLTTHLAGLPQKFKRPQAVDRLFDADYQHLSPTASCDDCDQTKLLSRKDRSSDEPEVFYGTIASGNSVIKDARLRDDLREKYNVLCFEMEAAGLMNNFTCIVVRGVCDYSDSHKMDQWQRYAAASAAAWAKELIRTVKPTAVTSMPKALRSLKQDIKGLMHEVISIAENTQKEAINRWLAPPDPSTKYVAALERRQPNSGVTLLRSADFDRWKTSKDNSMLWLHGKAGSGKTMLSASVLEHLHGIVDEQSIVLYYYFDTQTHANSLHSRMMRCFADRLCSKDQIATAELRTLYQAHDQGKSQPIDAEIQALVDGSLARFKEVWVLIDALDECERASRQDVVKWLRLSLANSSKIPFRVVMTSRDEVDIRNAVSQIQTAKQSLAVDGDIISPEIEAYVHRRLFEDSDFDLWRDQAVLKEIEDTVIQKVDGMFLWAKCLLDELQRCIDLGQLQQELSRLPSSLEETYDRMLQGIDSIHKEKAMFLMQLMLSSDRRLTLAEAVDAIATDSSSGKFDVQRRMAKPMDIAIICPSLITLSRRVKKDRPKYYEDCEECQKLSEKDKKAQDSSERKDKKAQDSSEEDKDGQTESNVDESQQDNPQEVKSQTKNSADDDEVRKVKKYGKVLGKMAQEFFENDSMSNNPEQTLSEQGALAMLDQMESSKALQGASAVDEGYQSDTADKDKHHHNPIHDHEVQFAHSSVKEYLLSEETVAGKSQKFTAATVRRAVVKTSLFYVMQLHVVEDTKEVSKVRPWARHSSEQWFRYARETEGVDPSIAPMMFTFFSTTDTLESWLQLYDPDYPRQRGIRSIEKAAPPLYYAALGGIVSLVERLSQTEDVNAVGGRYHDALQAACVNGHKEVVRLLIIKGANVNARDGLNKGQGTWATFKKVSNLATSKGRVIFSNNYGTALQAASFKGHTEIVRMLLQYKANVNLQYGGYGSALISAAIGGKKDIVEILIKNGAKINPGKISRTGEILPRIDNFVSQANDYIGPNSKLGVISDEVPTLLDSLDSVIAAPTCLTEFASALQGASYYGQDDVVGLLLENGAADHVQSMSLALEGAIMKSHVNIARTIVRKGGTALMLHGGDGYVEDAAEKSLNDVLETLFQYSGDQIALHLNLALFEAAKKGHLSTVQMVLNRHGSDSLKISSLPFNRACSNGYTEILHLILQHGFIPDQEAIDKALPPTAARGHLEIVRKLLQDFSVRPSAQSVYTAIEEACLKGYKDILQLLMESGTTPTQESIESALQKATTRGRAEIVEMLLMWAGPELGAQASAPAIIQASGQGHKDIVEILLRNDAAFDTPVLISALLGTFATSSDREDVVRCLLDHSDSGDLKLGYGEVLKGAARNGKTKTVAMLINSGVDVNSPCKEGTALQAAHNNEVAAMLIQSGAQIDIAADEHGNTLTRAAAAGDKDTVQRMLAAGADPNRKSNVRRRTALSDAAENGHLDIVKILLDHNANPNLTNLNTGSALIGAAANGHMDTVQLLLDRGADINIRTELQGNAIRAAAEDGHKEIVELLLGKGADPNVSSPGHGNAYQSALGKEHMDILPLLEEKTDPDKKEAVGGIGFKDVWKPGREVAGKLWKPGKKAAVGMFKKKVMKK